MNRKREKGGREEKGQPAIMEGEASLSCESFCSVYMFILENELVVTKGGQREGVIVREFGTDMYPLLYLRWITNKDLLYSTRNSA